MAIKKKKSYAFGKNIFLLGRDKDGTNYWLEEASWDCEWYWGGGYVETYTNNRNPKKSKDIQSHTHFDTLFFNVGKYDYDLFNELFVEHPFTKDEVHKILGLMREFYTVRKYSDLLHASSMYCTENPVSAVIKSEEEYNIINKTVIPKIMEELYKVLGGE